MTWVKICGITNVEDALASVDAGADALGFIFFDRSPRKIQPAAAGKIISELPREIEKVGVFVDEDATNIRAISQAAGLTAVQLYGIESIANYASEEQPAVKLIAAIPATSIGNGANPSGNFQAAVYALLIDSGSNSAPGGTGRRFDWENIQPGINALPLSLRVVIAGGLSPQNVAEAIDRFHPWGVDVVSGVESEPGKKDPKKVRAFIGAVRNADKNTQNANRSKTKSSS
jgi:phosphoribosylanthranilate isomerase